ncbi:hypothetical protein [Streptomyces niveus]|uniref:hypothetical protein n=1 Tax=Streptomyces niveus TaxID=193462 RepID=UPI0036D28D30
MKPRTAAAALGALLLLTACTTTGGREPVRGDTQPPPLDVRAHTQNAAARTWHAAGPAERDQLCAGHYPPGGPSIDWNLFEQLINAKCRTRDGC